jgi:hypothetical protein
MTLHPRSFVLASFVSVALWACGGAVAPDDVEVAPATDAVAANAEHETLHGAKSSQGGKPVASLPVTDHGGRVVPTINFYTIYWGTGFSPTTESLYTSFLGGLGSSPYWTINDQYLRGAANTAAFVASYTDTSSQPGTKVTDQQLRDEVHRVLAAGGLPYDPNGLYYVMTPKTTQVCSGLSCSCKNFCGYHSNYTDTQFGAVLYSSIPSAAACPTSCGIFSNDSVSPNRNVEADEGVSIIAHEGEEAQSDALGNAWFDRNGSENADKCAYKYGPTTTFNGAKVNQSWGGTSWLVQMNWSNQISGCAQQGPANGPFSQ